MQADAQMQKFKDLRLEYYSAGRQLWFSDGMEASTFLLGHTIELSLKQALILSGTEPTKAHSLPVLFQKCLERSIFSRVAVSEDFLLYAFDVFHQRYPSQAQESNKKAAERGQSISKSPDIICAYDDFILQLDDALQELQKDLSIGIQASHYVNRSHGRAFFIRIYLHSNGSNTIEQL